MKTTLASPSAASGFSLVELLMFLAIAGVIAAITIPHINTQNTAQTARDRRNAQELSSFTVAAQAAGLDLVVPGNLKATVEKVLEGGSPNTGSFRGRKFVAPKLSPEDAEAAARFLKIEANSLIYDYDGSNS
ncbi:MAG: prepilin-type N-terminal cleavage/methylation domain-containing protein [Verrucomicrobiaceae bacterium]|nr:prepilin-type N-terminal cleavage/methylation domain-containing protein [Verrucomicrobiaceae bacterium]